MHHGMKQMQHISLAIPKVNYKAEPVVTPEKQDVDFGASSYNRVIALCLQATGIRGKRMENSLKNGKNVFKITKI